MEATSLSGVCLPILDVSAMSLDQVHGELRSLQRLRSRFEALAVRLVARRAELLDAATNPGRGLAADAGLSGREAKQLARTASGVTKVPPCVSDAFEAGDITGEQVRALAASGLGAAAQTALLDEAAGLGPDAFRRRVHEASMAADDDHGRSRQARQHAAREASIGVDDDGMGVLRARLAADECSEVRSALDRAMDVLWRAEHPSRSPALSEQPSYGARLADALVHVCRRYLEPGGGNGAPAKKAVPSMMVMVDLESLSENLHATSRCSDSWGTPLTPETMRRLACEADIIPIVLGSGSVPLDVGRSRRYPTAAQRHAVIARDRRCRIPGCDAPPSWSDVHHVQHWVHDGPTDLHNLVLLCGRHHHAVHEGGWRLVGNANEELCLYSPAGTLVATSRPTSGGP